MNQQDKFVEKKASPLFRVELTSGKSFEASNGETLIEAAAKANVFMPYSCKTGRCSSCKCKVIRGETIALQVETGLSINEKAEGWILSCVRAVSSDLMIEAEDIGGAVLYPPKTLPCRIETLENLAPDVLQIRLRLPPAAEFKFVPGQYVDIIGPGGMRRSYSIACADSAAKGLELHIRSVDGGAMSEYWFQQAKANDLLRLNGPLGTFFLRDTANVELIFLATGTGIAPVKAILESIPDLTPEQKPKSVTVIWGARASSDLYLDVDSLPGNHEFIPVLSRADSEWAGARGYVQDVLIALKPNLRIAQLYVCGSDSMIRSAREKLLQAGLPANRFFSDAFVCSDRNFSN